jgi:hypothetical protein
MTSIKYSNGSYRAESIVKHGRDEYIAKNKDRAFKGMPESNVIAKLGELWDMARAAVPEPVVPTESKGGKKDKPKADPPNENVL